MWACLRLKRRRLMVGQGDQQERRRLRVGHGDQAVDEATKELLDELSAANLKDLLDSITEGSDRTWCMSSKICSGKTSFGEKATEQFGNVDINSTFCTCRKGLKPEGPNQDAWLILRVEERFSLYAVFDGHGVKGHLVSEFAKEMLPKLVIKDERHKDPEQIASLLKDCFNKTQALIETAAKMKTLEASMSGTTCILAFHDHTNEVVTVAHVGDCGAVLGTCSDPIKASSLTRDHKPDLRDEKKRIEQAGGRVVFDGYCNHRIYVKKGRYPGLNMSRCFGDVMSRDECGIIADPDIHSFKVKSEQVLLLCSDGVWEFIEPKNAFEIVMKHGIDAAKGGPLQVKTAAEGLAKASWDRWIEEEGGAVVDDITVLLVML